MKTVPDAMNLIQFQLKGDAEILGVGNMELLLVVIGALGHNRLYTYRDAG